MHQLTPVQVLFVWYGLRPLCFPAVCAISSSGITAAAATIAVRTFTVCNYIAAAFFEIAYVCAAIVHYELVLLYSPSAAHVPESECWSHRQSCLPPCLLLRENFIRFDDGFAPTKDYKLFFEQKKAHTRQKKQQQQQQQQRVKKGE